MENSFQLCDTYVMSTETVGGFIRRHRKAAKLSQEELASAIQMTNRSVSEWETGRTIPGRDALAKLAQLFHISLDDFAPFMDTDIVAYYQDLPPSEQEVRKQQAIKLIDELLADPQKLDEWLTYGEYLRERGRREGQ